MKHKSIGKKNIIIASAIVALMLIGSCFAYFIDRASVTNEFTVGDIKVQLTEPNWNQEDATKITPNMTIAKDPTVKNIGINDAYAFVKVDIPRADVKTVQPDGRYNQSALQDLFTFTPNNNWSLVKTETTNTHSTYYYGYIAANNKMASIAPNAVTNPLFDSVKFINITENQLEAQSLEIPVEVLAIQNSDLGTDVPAEILNLILNSNAS